MENKETKKVEKKVEVKKQEEPKFKKVDPKTIKESSNGFKPDNTSKPKTKTWIKILRTFVIALIIGFIGGAVALYYVQDNTDFNFLIPNSLVKKSDSDNNTQTNQNAGNTIENTLNTTNENNTAIDISSYQNNSNVLTTDEAYSKLTELYNVALGIYIAPNGYEEFTFSDKVSESFKNEGYNEITNYSEVMEKYYTIAGKNAFETFYKSCLVTQDGKTYMIMADGEYATLYTISTNFIKMTIEENSIKCTASTTYKEDSADDTQVKIAEKTFSIKKVNDVWKIDQFELPVANNN